MGLPIFPGEVYQAGIGQGYDVVTPIQLINAYAALANGGRLLQPQIVRDVIGPDGTVVRPFAPKLIHELKSRQSVLSTMREAARTSRPGPAHLQPRGSPADRGRQVRNGGIRYQGRRGPAAVPLVVRRVRPEGPDQETGDRQGMKAVDRTDSDLVVLAFAYDSRTKGNVATEIVKYYLQLHYGIKKDYRNFNLLVRGNFYQTN